MDRVSVVIPVYGQWHLLKRNLESLLRFDSSYISEIIVVDDCSPEPNPYDFESPLVGIIKNDNNLGYTGTVNAGLKKASSEVILLLDSDAYLITPIISEVLTMYQQNPKLGCVGYKTVDDAGRVTGSYCLEPMVLGLILGQQLEARFDKMNLVKNRNIMPYSCSVSFRKACLEELHYFDQVTFPVLDADLDLSMRIHRSKWQLLFNPNIILSHSGGNSYKINYKRVLLFYKSRWLLFQKHGLIKHPNITKSIIKKRVWIEMYIFKLIYFFNSKESFLEKKKGRSLILEAVSTYK